MNPWRRVALIRFLMMGAVPLLVLSIGLPAAEAQAAPAPGAITISKICRPQSGSFIPAGSVLPGTTLQCLIKLTLGPGTYTGLIVSDVVTNGGRASDTVVGFGTLVTDSLNRQVYVGSPRSMTCGAAGCEYTY